MERQLITVGRFPYCGFNVQFSIEIPRCKKRFLLLSYQDLREPVSCRISPDEAKTDKSLLLRE